MSSGRNSLHLHSRERAGTRTQRLSTYNLFSKGHPEPSQIELMASMGPLQNHGLESFLRFNHNWEPSWHFLMKSNEAEVDKL